ncbi:hypothetical protein [Actinocorallia sp. A-T 12471]|uniref:hypothetical protein n=1 Tax=Actinocorallia sp. A-T 12471 TaxID=3089813 RepID=UPI0029CCF3AB|nr:hypothetical protein [Actinocorallia sp. A-T 12471]MDX6741523.1 hypothetical protein [Actinocorallia sp. A-T 12471]
MSKTRRRDPNHALRGLMAEAGYSNTALASAVNRVGREVGLALRYDRTAVSHWLAGTAPRRTAAPLIAETLSRRLGRPVGVAELGAPVRAETMPGTRSSGALAITEVTALAELDGRPSRRAATPIAYDLNWTRSVGAPPAPADRRESSGERWRVGPGEAALAEQAVALFARSADRIGAGHVRSSISAYLVSPISGWLTSAAPDRTHRRLLTAAAQLVHLLADVCADAGVYGLAQRYHAAELRLAHEADDPVMRAMALRAMSKHARHLGHLAEAANLAETALRTAGTGAAASIRSFLLAEVAVTAALTGDARRATRSMDRSLRLVEGKGGGVRHPFTHYPLAAAHFQHALVREALREPGAAAEALRCSLAERDVSEHRALAHSLALLASFQLAGGRVETACESWRVFLLHYRHLNSRQADQRLHELRSLLTPYRRSTAVQKILCEAARVTAEK